MPDLNFQDFSTVQSIMNSKPTTIASAATIAPTNFFTRLTGAVAVTTITPPVSGCHMLALSFAGVSGVATGGNITSTVASVADRPMLLIYDPRSGTYFVVTVA